MTKTTTKKQIDLLLNAMQANPDVACGMFKGSKEDLNRIWCDLGKKLDSSGPPTKSIAEWKKVWCDQKKYVRHKASENLKHTKGTGGGPNKYQQFSPNEQAIYNLIGMKESVEGMANRYGLGSSTSTSTSTILPPLEEFSDELENFDPEGDKTITPPPAKKVKKKAQSKLSTDPSASEVLGEEISIQKKMLETLAELQQNTKKTYRSIDRLYDLKKQELQEQTRHNYVMEKLRVKEVENKIEKNKKLLELENLRYNND